MCSIVGVWSQCWQAVGGPRDKIWDFVALVWPIRSRVITTSSALVRCWNLLGDLRRYRSLPCIDTFHLIWTSCWMQEFTSGFKSAKWTVVSGSMSWLRVSFASWSTISFPSTPQWLGTQQKRTHVPLSLNAQREEIPDLANERVVSIFAFNCLQARHWVRVDYDILLYPCANNSSVPMRLLLPQQQRWYCYLGVFWTAGRKSSHHSGNGGWWPLLPPLSRQS